MGILLFQGRLVATAREGIVAVFCEILAPLRQGAVRHAQFAGNLRLRFLAGLEQADRFHLKFFRVRLLLFLHDTCSPLWSPLSFESTPPTKVGHGQVSSRQYPSA